MVKDSADKNVATRSLQRCSDKIIQILAKIMQGNPTVFIKRADLAEAGINLPLVDLNGLHELSDKLELDKTAEKLLAEYVLRNLSGSTVRQVCTAALRECLKEGLMSRLVLKHKKKNKRKNTVVKTVFKAFKVYETLRDAVLSYCTSNSITCTPKCVDQGFSYRLTKEGSAALAVEDSESEQETNESNNVQQQQSVQVGELSARSAHPIAQYQEAIDSGEDVDMMYKQATAQNTHDSSFDSE
ncbi:uncharacterized protein LOC135936810 [Cloeon dipterum]|uniref:uncharacterized protein LOC135936810 n=1 Tax=Cloeon dipterum TaxID=197152 RepID=UPI003220480F